MLGDGNINYGWEHLAELYYAINLFKQHIFITGAYQFILNPGYNKDRQGPISVLSVRLHAQF
jgi:high affinity Mn2+ porin